MPVSPNPYRRYFFEVKIGVLISFNEVKHFCHAFIGCFVDLRSL